MPPLPPVLALVAHDLKKDDLADWVERHLEDVGRFPIVATGTTGKRLHDRFPSLGITRLASGPLGGDQQIGARIVTGEVAGLIFFTDPLTPMPHDVDVKALTRLATLYDIPMACSPTSADFILEGLVRRLPPPAA